MRRTLNLLQAFLLVCFCAQPALASSKPQEFPKPPQRWVFVHADVIASFALGWEKSDKQLVSGGLSIMLGSKRSLQGGVGIYAQMGEKTEELGIRPKLRVFIDDQVACDIRLSIMLADLETSTKEVDGQASAGVSLVFERWLGLSADIFLFSDSRSSLRNSQAIFLGIQLALGT